MDWIIALGGFTMAIIGLVGRFRPDLLWRLYSLEPRWRKNNPEQPDNWQEQAKKQGLYLFIFGVFFFILAFALGD
jgi:hypothetical protein